MLKRNGYLFAVVAVVVLVFGVVVAVAKANVEHDENRGGKYAGKYAGENRGKPLQPARLNALWQQECSSCHLAYAPGLLPAESWRKIMKGLDQHFGSDASLTAQENEEITDFLVRNASNCWSAPTAPLRITESVWFRHKHDGHKIAPSVWKKPQVKSPANCGACHTQAESGDFSERNIRMPQ